MTRLSRDLALATAIALLLLGSGAWADDDRYGDPEMGHSIDPDDLEAGSEDSDELEGESRDSDDLTVGAEDPDAMIEESEDPDALSTETEDPDEKVDRSRDLGDLPEGDGSEDAVRPEPQLVPEVPPPGPDASPGVHAAWRQVESAERNLDAINAVYEDMMGADYPRGERRARIIAERNDLIDAVNRARTHYAELRGE